MNHDRDSDRPSGPDGSFVTLPPSLVLSILEAIHELSSKSALSRLPIKRTGAVPPESTILQIGLIVVLAPLLLLTGDSLQRIPVDHTKVAVIYAAQHYVSAGASESPRRTVLAGGSHKSSDARSKSRKIRVSRHRDLRPDSLDLDTHLPLQSVSAPDLLAIDFRQPSSPRLECLEGVPRGRVIGMQETDRGNQEVRCALLQLRAD